ncbi:MAG TPA: glycosyltransferase family 39 protein [Acidobacteriota bacterium]|nr:glycosyltransferase family 39 protein [Acidobacteriota bacterium]
MEDRFSRLLVQICWAGCLLGGVATVYFLAGLAGALHYYLLNFTVAIALAAAQIFFLYQFAIAAKGAGWLGWLIWAALLFVSVAESLLGLLPPTSRDELTHHLAIPNLYVKAGRIIEVPMASYAYYPMLLDMLFTPWIYWGYDFVPKWIHALYGGLTGLLLYAYLSRRMSTLYGLLGWFFFLSTPIILRLSHWGYNDLGITFYTTGSVLCLLRWREERESLRWLALTGLLLGFALATKPNGLVAALIIALLFAQVIVTPPRKNFLALWQEVICLGLLSLAPFLPWLVKNWWQTGNPLFPFFDSWFHAAGPAGPNFIGSTSIGIFAKRELLFGENIWQIIALPLRVFFSGQDDKPQYFDGVLTPVLILFLPWSFKGKWLEDKKLIASFAFLLLVYALFLVDMRIRYILSIVPLLVILLAYGIFNVFLRIKRPAVLYAVLLCFAGWHGIYLWRYIAQAQPSEYLLGRINRTAYLMRMLPEYAAFDYINRKTSTDANIYLLFVGRRAYYCDRDYFHDGGDLPNFLLASVRTAKNAEQIEASLKQKQITHLMVREDLLATFLSNNLTADQARLWNEFAANRVKLDFRARGYAVYQLHG